MGPPSYNLTTILVVNLPSFTLDRVVQVNSPSGEEIGPGMFVPRDASLYCFNIPGAGQNRHRFFGWDSIISLFPYISTDTSISPRVNSSSTSLSSGASYPLSTMYDDTYFWKIHNATGAIQAFTLTRAIASQVRNITRTSNSSTLDGYVDDGIAYIFYKGTNTNEWKMEAYSSSDGSRMAARDKTFTDSSTAEYNSIWGFTAVGGVLYKLAGTASNVTLRAFDPVYPSS